jgi:hypothetical protein
MFNRLSVLILLIVMVACGQPSPRFDDIDLTQWKNDKNACGKYRTSVIAAVQKQTDKLLALNELQLVTLLGKPDRSELYKRNQKFYYYYLKPSPDCPSLKGETLRLAIRFNAMGLAQEVVME